MMGVSMKISVNEQEVEFFPLLRIYLVHQALIKLGHGLIPKPGDHLNIEIRTGDLISSFSEIVPEEEEEGPF